MTISVTTKRNRTPRQRSLVMRVLRGLLFAVLWFVLGSVLWVAVYRFVPPPMTLTMLGNAISGNGLTKSWMPLSRIDPNMARAAIAGEDGRFCTHHGFDFEAIQKAMQRNAKGGRSAAARRSASRPQRTSS